MRGFDLFGLKKGSAAEEPASAGGGKPLPAQAWKGLAAADAALLLACLTLLVVRVRGHLSAPPPPPARPPAAKKAEPKPPEPKVEAPPPAPEAKKPEPKPEAKKPEPKPEAKKPEPKPEPKPAAKAPLGSPAIHAAPAPRRDPGPVGAAPSGGGAPPPPSFAPKAAATRPVPFSYEESGAKEVYLVGPFLVRSGGRKTMFKNSRGAWQTTVYLNIGQTYKYRFEVVGENGKKLTPARSVEVLEAD